MMTSKISASASASSSLLALGAFIVLGAGCAATTESPEPVASDTASTESDDSIESSSAALLAGGGGGALGFSCSGLGCICHGDADCNNMFDGNACGSWPSKCYERGPGPVYCICAPWVGRAQVRSGVGVVATTTGAISR